MPSYGMSRWFDSNYHYQQREIMFTEFWLKKQWKIGVMHEMLRENYKKSSQFWIWHNKLARNAHRRHLANGGTFGQG